MAITSLVVRSIHILIASSAMCLAQATSKITAAVEEEEEKEGGGREGAVGVVVAAGVVVVVVVAVVSAGTYVCICV